MLFLAGIVAGIMNTVGGGGSVLTLPALIFLGGLSGPDANATNRIGILAQNMMAIWRFRKGGVSETSITWRVCAVGLLGAGMGSLMAAWMPDQQFEALLGILMLILLVPLLRKPKSGLREEGAIENLWTRLSRRKKQQTLDSFFLIGVYAGFIQAGAGIVILVALGQILHMNLVRANYVKLVFILVLNILALSIFIFSGLYVDWIAGIFLFIGQMVGAYAGSWVALKKGENWIKVILVVSIVASSIKLLGIWDFFFP